jgi:hypothetical protein
MIRGAAGGDSYKPTDHWSFSQSPVASMVPGFVFIPLVTLSFPKGNGVIPFRRLHFYTTWAVARGDYKSR